MVKTKKIKRRTKKTRINRRIKRTNKKMSKRIKRTKRTKYRTKKKVSKRTKKRINKKTSQKIQNNRRINKKRFPKLVRTYALTPGIQTGGMDLEFEDSEGEEEDTENKMQTAIDLLNDELQLNVPLGIDVQFGKTYADVHQYKKSLDSS